MLQSLRIPSLSGRFGNRSVGFAVLVAASCLPVQLASAQQAFMLAATHTPMHPVAFQGGPTAESPQAGDSNTTNLKDDLFTGTEKFAKGATDATEVNMDPDSLNLVGGPNAGRAHRTLLNVVRTYSYDKPGMYNPADVEEYRRKLESGDWHCSVHTRDLKTGESTDICSRRRAPDLIETAIITMEPKELTFIHTIRKANGQGGKMDDTDFDSTGFSAELPPGEFAAMHSKLQADMLAAQAKIEAQVAAMSLKSMPSLAQLQQQLGSLDMDKLTRSREMQQLEQQLKDLQQHPPRLR